jgi:hypothetical protein
MPVLTFNRTDENDAIAVVRGGDMNGALLYLDKSEGAKGSDLRREVPAAKYASDLKAFKLADRVKLVNRIQEAIDKKTAFEGTDAEKALFEKVKADMVSHIGKDIELPTDSTFEVVPSPDPKKREVYYVAGQSGSGKSYFARSVAQNYRRLYPDRGVYLISKLMEDETLDNMVGGKPARIDIDSLVADYPKLDEFKDCLVIFDDWDTLEKEQYRVVHKLIEDLAIMGRHTCTSMLILSHYLNNYKSTRLMLLEAHYLVLYPQSTSFKALKYVLENYGGLDKEQIQEARTYGRWVMVKKGWPMYMISAHKAKMLNT